MAKKKKTAAPKKKASANKRPVRKATAKKKAPKKKVAKKKVSKKAGKKKATKKRPAKKKKATTAKKATTGKKKTTRKKPTQRKTAKKKTAPTTSPPSEPAASAREDSAPTKAVQAAINYLRQEDVLRERNDPDTGRKVVQLYHDYLSRAVLEAERRADRWPTVARERQRAFDEAGDSLPRRWRGLLTPWQQIRLLIERLRGRFRYGETRGFAAASTIRFIPYLMVLTLAFVGWRVYQVQEQRQRDNDTAQRIMRMIHGQGDYPDSDEFDAFWVLAESPERVRLSFLEQMVTQKERADALKHRYPWVLHAIVGLDVDMRDEARGILEEHGNPPATNVQINLACAELGRLLDIGDRSFHEMVAANYVAAMEKAEDSDALSSLGSALASLGEKLPSEEATKGAQRIVAAMEKTEDYHPLEYRAFDDLGSALASLVKRMKPKDAMSVLKSVVCVEDVRDEVLAELDKRAGGAINGDIWKAVTWAKKEGVDDIKTVPRSPLKGPK